MPRPMSDHWRPYHASSTTARAVRALAGIEPYEVRQALEAKLRWSRPGADLAGTSVLTIWGRTLAGRALVVAVYHLSGFAWKIVGARDMTDGELAEFARWEETR